MTKDEDSRTDSRRHAITRERFPALRFTAGALRLATWLMAGVMVLSAVPLLIQKTTTGVGIGVLILAMLTWVAGMVTPELINVMLSIEASVYALARRDSHDQESQRRATGEGRYVTT